MDERLTDAEIWQLFGRMFPEGLDDRQIVEELGRCGFGDRSPAERADLLGRGLWDVLSNNHEVFTAEGRAVDLGSFRATAGFIADLRSRREATDPGGRYAWDYLDFYMGTVGTPTAVDLCPLYERIFTRMRALGLDWRYVHPRLYLIDFGTPEGPEDHTSYNPHQALQRELEQTRHAAELAELRESLDRGYRESVEEARRGPPPAIVQSYARVYGRLPAGWPPTV
ncbi:MAG: hypothetical protein AB1505_28905 [Candidatus Latescibacterota bacterium]